MALQGTLETFSVEEVFRLLAGTRKTGRLVLDGDLGAVEVWMTDGRLCAAAGMGDSIEDAVVHAMRMTTGRFEFVTGDGVDHGAVHRTDDLEVDAVLAAAAARVASLREADAVIPSESSQLRLAARIDTPTVTIDQGDWALVATIATAPRAGDLAAELGLDRVALAERVRPLVALGVVTVVAAAAEPSGGDWSTVADWTDRDDWDDDIVAPAAPAEPGDVVAQAQALSAKAAAAIEAVSAADPAPEPAVAIDRTTGDEDATRSLLLRFLSTTKP